MPWFATKSAHTAERRVSAFKRTQWISGYIQNMNACLEPGAVEQSSYSVNIRAANDPLAMLYNYGVETDY